MFGYVSVDNPNLYVKDVVLYRASYCGLCKSLGSVCGQRARFLLSYDLTFLSILLHNVTDSDVKINNEHCVIHPIKKRPVVKTDELNKRVARANVILAYYKAVDDVTDEHKGRLKKSFVKGAYKKAKKAEPVIDKIVFKYYKGLNEYEKTEGDSVDISADFFGNMMKEIVVELSGTDTEELKGLSYSLGKWVYLIDAIDDFDKDKKKGSYNVFVNIYKDYKDRQSLLNEKKEEIEEIFADVLYSVSEYGKNVKYRFNHDLIDNVLQKGLKSRTKLVLEGRKCKNIIKY